MPGRAAALSLVLAVAVAGCFGPQERYEPPASTPASPTGSATGSFALEKVLEGLAAPLYLFVGGPGEDVRYIVEQAGRIVAWDGGAQTSPFLDIRERVSCCGERGLLGAAFHPDFPEDPRLFVSYTDNDGDTVVESYPVVGGSPRPEAAATVLTVDQPYANHNGGMIVFGPDGYLYVGLGDGGSGGDPEGNGQNTATLLGSLLRLDVSGGDGYTSPEDNPFVGRAGRDEIWAYGLRNPWRFSFDAETGDLFIADVGQNAWEEVNFQPAGSGGGENYGWNRFEGSHVYEAGTSAPDAVAPVAEYARAGGHCSVTGGHVYRGGDVSALDGAYVFGDYCSGTLWSLRMGDGWRMETLLDTDLSVSSFGVDAAGELYVIHHGGALYRFVAS